MSSRVGFGQRRVRVTAEALEAWLVNGGMVKTDLPDDAHFLRMYPEQKGRWYFLVFESEEWDEIPEGAEIPEKEIEVQDTPIRLKVKK